MAFFASCLEFLHEALVYVGAAEKMLEEEGAI